MNELKVRTNYFHVQKFVFKSIFYQVFSSKLVRHTKQLISYTVTSDLKPGSLICYISFTSDFSQ